MRFFFCKGNQFPNQKETHRMYDLTIAAAFIAILLAPVVSAAFYKDGNEAA